MPAATTFRTWASLLLWMGMALSGIAAVVVARAVQGRAVEALPAPWPEDFRLARDADNPVHITPSRWLELPLDYADYDLWATVEIPEGGELDLVFRRRDPANTHGRFALLRLSATQAGPPYRTREQALFDDAMVGGVRLRPGVPASVHLQARGRQVRANVAGMQQPWFETVDAQGRNAFVVRGGTALLRYLYIRPQERERWPPWCLGAIAALLAWMIVRWLGAWLGAPRADQGSSEPGMLLARFAVLLPGGAWLGAHAVLVHLAPQTEPSTAGLLTASLCGLPLAVALGWPRTARVRRPSSRVGGLALRVLLGVLLALAMLEATTRLERARLDPLGDPRLQLYFGWGSRTAPFDALSKRLSSKNEIYALDNANPRLLFLGGETLFESGEDRANHIGVQVAAALSRAKGRKIEAVVVPTLWSNALQQLLLWRRFYLDMAPKAIVFGVGRFESEPSERMTARRLLEEGDPICSWSLLWALHQRLVRGHEPASTPSELERALDELRQLCRERGIDLVLATDAELPAPLRQVMRDFSARHGVALVEDVINAAGQAKIAPLVHALEALRWDR